MKRFFALLLTLLLALSCLTGALAYSNPDCDVGKHTMGPWQTLYGPSCTYPGEKHRECLYCGYDEYAEIPPAGHWYPDPWVTTIAPTCTKDGQEMNSCKRVIDRDGAGGVYYCGNIWYRVLPALGHDWGEWYVAKAPTHEEDGYEQRDCSRCGIFETRPLTLDDDGGEDGGDDIGDMEVDIEKTVFSTPANGSFYTEGETVSYGVTVINCQNVSYYDVEVIDPLRGEDENSILATLAVFEPHAVIERSFDYIVTAEDVERGFIENTAIVYWREEGEEEPWDMLSNTVTVSTGVEETPASVSLLKTVVSTPANGMYYEPGEVITYHVTFHKDGPVMNRLVMYDPLCTDDPYNRVAWDAEAGAGNYFTGNDFTYVVTETDAAAGVIANQAYATWESPEINGETVCWSNVCTVPVGFEGDEPVPQSDVTISKMFTTSPANGLFYTEGEMIGYRVYIENSGDGPACNVVMDDYIWTSPMSIGEIAAGETFYGDYSHTVTGDDIDMGGVLNCAWIEYENVLGDYRYAESQTLFAPCGVDVPDDGILYLDKYLVTIPDNGNFFVEGDVVEFKLKFGNTYDRNAYDVEVHDKDECFGIGTLAPGETGEVHYFYTVTAEDAANGYFTNQGSILWGLQSGVQDKINWSRVLTVDTGIEEPKPYADVTVGKVLLNAPADGIAFTESETVSYLLTVTNTGTMPICGVELYDAMWTLSNSYTTLLNSASVLQPGESITEVYSYVVTYEDCVDGTIKNEADVYYYLEEDPYTECFAYSDIVRVPTHPGEGPVPAAPEFGVYKYEASVPKNHMYYEKGETVHFVVVAYNNSGVTFTDVSGYDILLDTAGYYFGSMPTLDSDPAYMNIYYTVTDIDVLMGYVSNVAWVEATDPDGNVHTVISNEVTVPVGEPGDPYPIPGGGNDNCDVYTTARGNGVLSVKTDYCAEHGHIDEIVSGLLSEAETAQQKTAALETAVKLWSEALEKEYARLLSEADENMKPVILREQAASGGEMDSRFALYENSGTMDGDELALLRIRLLRERTCELCAARAAWHGILPDHGEAAEAENGSGKTVCSSVLEEGRGCNTVSVELCGVHTLTDKTVLRLMTALPLADESTADAIRTKIAACRENDLTAAMTAFTKKAGTASVSAVIREKLSLETRRMNREALIRVLYEQFPERAEELIDIERVNETAFLCGIAAE